MTHFEADWILNNKPSQTVQELVDSNKIEIQLIIEEDLAKWNISGEEMIDSPFFSIDGYNLVQESKLNFVDSKSGFCYGVDCIVSELGEMKIKINANDQKGAIILKNVILFFIFYFFFFNFYYLYFYF